MNRTAANNTFDAMNVKCQQQQNDEDAEYYPRLKRAPYIYDGSDFGNRPPRVHLGGVEIDVPLNDDGDGGMSSGGSTSGSTLRTSNKAVSSSNLSQQQSPAARRRSSFARVFSSLGMSPTPIAEAASVEGSQVGGEKSPLMLVPSRIRRGSSADVTQLRGVALDSARDRLGTSDNLRTNKYPQWALHDPASIVMKDGYPVTVGTLIQHHILLNQPHSQHLSPHCIVTPTWRLKERMKTVGVCLILALNIGTDPPDLNKPTPCAKLQCWLDPTTISRAKAKERIGERLEQQYAKWQQRSKLKYRRAMDPTVDTVKELCLRMRESAKGERVLLHYNGHGVPRPTANGEIWLFDRHHTNYIPLSVTDLRRWIGKPSIVVLDCSGAGNLMPFFTVPLNDGGEFPTTGTTPPLPLHRGSSSATMDNSDPSNPSDTMNGPEYNAIRDTIVLCPTAAGEWLPLKPELPADVFTSCLTTPIPIALRWFVYQNPLSMEMIDLETIADAIPGKLTDRKTPLGELNWIFTAVTDTIAWNVLPSALFQRLFRQDLLVASMFRNFLLAERILRSLNCSPMSIPEIPSTCNHPLWHAWDLAVETCLRNLIDQGYLRKSSSSATVPSSDDEGDETIAQATHDPQPVTTTVPHTVDAPFFAEQLTAFEIWLEYANTKPKSQLVIRSPPSAIGGTPLPYLYSHGSANTRSSKHNPHEMDPPVELPIVLQVLLSQTHRVRALVLLKRFLELGPSAVNLALSVGIFPYVLKLLQSQSPIEHVLVAIWARIMAFDESCQVDVVKDRALSHFIRHLSWGLTLPTQSTDLACNHDASEQRTMAAFILSIICSNYVLGQSECINEKLHLACGSLLQRLECQDDNERTKAENDLPPTFRTWICICLGNLTKDNFVSQSEVYLSGLHYRLLSRLDDTSPDVRAAACYALSCLIGSAPIQPLASIADQQPPLPPQEMSPTVQLLTASIPGTLSALAPNTLMPAFDNTPQQSYGLGLQPFPIPNSAPTGVSYLAPGKEQPTMFGASMAPKMSSQTYAQTEIRTVFEDHQRMNMDIVVSTELARVLSDGSPVVRFEAALALNRFVAKYIEAVVSVAGESVGGLSQRNIMGGINPSIPPPYGMSSDSEKSFSEIWTQVLKLYRSDPQPAVRVLLNSIVSSVNERVLSEKSKLRQQRQATRRQSMFSSSAEEGTDAALPSQPLVGRRNATGTNLASYVHGSPQSMRRSGSIGMSINVSQEPCGTACIKSSQTSSAMLFDLIESDLPCPESMFYRWKKVEFADRSDDEKRQSLDLLSDSGAIKKYRSTRNRIVQQKGQLLKDSFAILAAQKPPPASPYATSANDLASSYDKEIDIKKEATNLKQISVLQNSTARGTTSLLSFHPYEPALVVCGGPDNVTCWNAVTSERMVSFSNENPKNTRMTAVSWINETNTSLLLTGCSDGSVRIWDGLFEPNDEMSREKPTLISSFFGAPDVNPDKGSTGLILEYQRWGGQLISGGNTKLIRCWDLASEKCRNSFQTGSDALLTTLTSTWNYSFSDGYSGLGPDVFLAGYSNGVLKLYDSRSKDGAPAMHLTEGRNSAVTRRLKYSEFDEHSSWIIDVSFTTFGGRHEVISGCVAGSIKYWDLRYSSSIRTLDHKMQMTALTVHSNIPMLATGSPAQFIKTISHDGTTQQVIRYHEKIPGQRIGPVSCLSFHPHMPYLAAGFSDELVSVFGPKHFGER
eukprot:CCRYP_005406-RB/>CCRYP_005406-RB protein AED:0.22 eAED:0.22 QI:45/1/1/1/0.6/0.5/6/884/1709